MTRLARLRNCSVSTATLRPEDLIPSFASALALLLDAWEREPGAAEPRKVRRYQTRREVLGEIERRIERGGAAGAAYFASGGADWDLEWLTDQLDEWAPPGTSFGSHPGDGADFGFWADWDDEPAEVDQWGNEMVDDDGSEDRPRDLDAERLA